MTHPHPGLRQRRQTHEVKTSPYGEKTAGKDELGMCGKSGDAPALQEDAVSGLILASADLPDS
jgi:hypothetical protein